MCSSPSAPGAAAGCPTQSANNGLPNSRDSASRVLWLTTCPLLSIRTNGIGSPAQPEPRTSGPGLLWAFEDKLAALHLKAMAESIGQGWQLFSTKRR
jgi:hypothetical protein